MADALQFPFTIMNPALGDTSSLPLLPLTLTHQQRDLSPMGFINLRIHMKTAVVLILHECS